MYLSPCSLTFAFYHQHILFFVLESVLLRIIWKMLLLYNHVINKWIHLNVFVTMEVWPLSSLYVWSRIKFISSWIIKCNKQEGDMNAMCNLWQIEQDADIAKIAFIIRLVKLTPSQFTVYDVMKLYSRQETALYHVLYWTMYCLRILE